MFAKADAKEQETACSGWILYTDEEHIRNRRYIALYQKAGRKYDVPVELVIYRPAAHGDDESRQRLVQKAEKERPAFIINRTRDYRLAKMLEERGIRVYNNSQVAELGNDKAKACRFMESAGIPVMPAVYDMDSAPRQYPAVVKSCGGHGGREVWFLEDEAAWFRWKRNLYRPGTAYMVQQAASDLGKDVRVYIVGNQIAAAVLRSNSRDFRSNYCLGGTVRLYELSTQERALVRRAVRGLWIGMAGIDFIFHHGKLVFNELEDMAGARSLYTLTDYDIADAYVRFICQDTGCGCLCPALADSFYGTGFSDGTDGCR